MAVLVNHLLINGLQSVASSYTTASISPTANRLVVLTVFNEKTNPTTVPTVTGAGMTWTNFFSRESASKNTKRVTMFRALSTSPGSGALTIDFGGTNQAVCGWNITEFDGIDTSGSNGANAIVQSVGNDNNTAGNTGLTVTLAAFSSSSNATHGVVAWGSGTAITQGSGFTELGEVQAGPEYQSQWRNDNDTTVDWTWASNTDSSIGAAIEIKGDIATTSTSITTSTSTTSTSSSTTTSTSTSTTVSVTTSTSTTSTSKTTSTTTTSTSTTSTSTSTTSTSTSTTSTSTTLDLKFSVERI